MKISTLLPAKAVYTAFLFFFCFIYFPSVAYAQTNWNLALPTDGAGSIGAETGRNLCTDGDGNIYVVGSFNGVGGATDFDLSAGTNTFTSANIDGYIVSYDKNGAFRWKTIITSAGNDFGAPGGAIATNGTFVWFAGSANFSGSASIITGSGTSSITSTTATVDAVVGKLNCSNGSVQWVTGLGGAGNSDFGQGITFDPNGDCYLIGSYGGSFTLNGITTAAPSGTTDVFVAKFSTTGTMIRFVGGGSSGGDMIVNGGAIVYVPSSTPALVAVGSFNGASATFGSFTVTNISGSGIDAFLMELDTTLGITHAVAIGSSAVGNDELLGAVYEPTSTSVYVCGYFSGPNITFPGTSVLTSAGSTDIMLARYTLSANNFYWSRSAGGTSTERAYAISTDARGLFVSGFSSSATCSFGAINVNAGAGSNDIVVAKYMTNAAVLWALAAGGTGNDEARGVYNYVETTPVYTQSVVVHGIFQNSVTFNGTTLTADGGNDFFLARINDAAIILPLRLISFSGRRLSATSNKLTWETADESNTQEFIVRKSNNGADFYDIGSVPARNDGRTGSYNYEDRSAANTAWYQLKMVDMDGRTKYSNIIRLANDDLSAGVYLTPNPVKSSFQLHVNDRLINTKASIHMLNGQQVKVLLINDRNMVVDADDLLPGIYFIKLENGPALRFIKE
jgi:hypothetical protein